MNVLDKIKAFWNKITKKDLQLPEGNNEYDYSSYQNNNFFNYNSYPDCNDKISQEMENFLWNYYNRTKYFKDNGINYPDDKMAYSALITLNGKSVSDEEYNYNENNQMDLLMNMQLDPSSRYFSQEENGFYHIRSKQYSLPPSEDLKRMYINCNNGNIASLTNLILNQNTNNNFYLKFTDNARNRNSPRGEKIVIYYDKKDEQQTLNLVENCRQISPELFRESENRLPFIQNVNGLVSIASEPPTNVYTDLYGGKKIIAKSVNSFISNFLTESYMETVKEIARNDTNLSFLFQENYQNDKGLFIMQLPYINTYYRNYLLQSMKPKMDILSKTNQVYVDGLDEYNQNYYQNDYTQNRDSDDWRGY